MVSFPPQLRYGPCLGGWALRGRQRGGLPGGDHGRERRRGWFFISAAGNFIKKMKIKAIDDDVGHFDKDCDMAGSARAVGAVRPTVLPTVDELGSRLWGSPVS